MVAIAEGHTMDIDSRGRRRGQAMYEMAIGMFLLVLLASALFSFGDIILTSLEQQDRIREEAGRKALDAFAPDDVRVRFMSSHGNDSVTVEPIAAEYFFDSQEIKVQNEVHMPVMAMDEAEP